MNERCADLDVEGESWEKAEGWGTKKRRAHSLVKLGKGHRKDGKMEEVLCKPFMV